MNFEWDEAKSEACFTQRGFDFAYVARADPNRIVHADTRLSYGEERSQLMDDRTATIRGGLHPAP